MRSREEIEDEMQVIDDLLVAGPHDDHPGELLGGYVIEDDREAMARAARAHLEVLLDIRELLLNQLPPCPTPSTPATATSRA